MTHYEIVKKIIGPISPLGDGSRDPERMENLKNMCELVNKLVADIDDVHYLNKDSLEHSVKIAADYAEEFIRKTLGIND